MPVSGVTLPIVDESGRPPLEATGSPVSRVMLVCMPFQHLKLSSLSVGLLATVLRDHGIACREAYLHFAFARLVGRRAYTIISDSGSKNTILGEVLFAEHYRGAPDEGTDRALEPVFGAREARGALMASFAACCLETIARADCGIVGFSTSFNQLFPSLWLARLIKAQSPATRIVFGGSACSSPMGERIAEYYPDVDLVVSGFGEQPLLDLALGRTGFESRFVHNDQPVNLDTLPIPDYEAFVGEWRAFDDHSDGGVQLTFETSRGCWWGQKHHCKFCGLNQREMAFNAKSSERVVEEVRALWDRHGLGLFATDTILSRKHLKEALPRLAEYSKKPELFYEVKANMARREVATLRAANVSTIQPGIESLNSTLLRLIDKGVRAIQNLALLKWCREEGITPTWNILYGIPGERKEYYFEQIELFDRIPHFRPPEGAHLIQLDRFSPYFNSYREHGWLGIEPLPAYRLLHRDMSEQALRDVAYHFDGIGAPFVVQEYESLLKAAVDRWKMRHQAGDGMYRDPAEGLLAVADGTISTIEGDDRLDAVIACTREIVDVGRVIAETRADDRLLTELVDLGVLWREGDQLINLVVEIGS
jgi:ribosomal peptide maturation radical SAM protein 1